MAEFIINRGSKVLADVINAAWEMECAKERIRARNGNSRFELLNEARDRKVYSCIEAVTNFGYN